MGISQSLVIISQLLIVYWIAVYRLFPTPEGDPQPYSRTSALPPLLNVWGRHGLVSANTSQGLDYLGDGLNDRHKTYRTDPSYYMYETSD